MKAQYLAHKIFKAGGLIRKLLTHAELQKLSQSEMEFLVNQAQQPWRFCFSMIIDNPTTDVQKTQTTSLWFNLIAYNALVGG